jgi:hypothetical protein
MTQKMTPQTQELSTVELEQIAGAFSGAFSTKQVHAYAARAAYAEKSGTAIAPPRF